MLEAVTWDEI